MKLKKKIKIVDKEFLTLHLKNDSSTSTFEIGENVYLFAFISSFGVCIYARDFFDIVRSQTSNKKSTELDKSRSKLFRRVHSNSKEVAILPAVTK